MARDASRAVLSLGTKFLLNAIPPRVKWAPGEHPGWVQSKLVDVKFPDAMHLARRIYARILCELWIATDRRVL